VLGLLPGQLEPQLQEKLIRLGSWLPFEPAASLFTALTGVAVSKATCRRLTEKGGEVQVERQEGAVVAMEAGELVTPERVAEKLLLSTDGAMVPLVGGEWAEVRTLAIGEVLGQETGAGQQETNTHALSYFSRLTDGLSFQRAALVETERRGLLHAPAVAAVNDGAEWIQSFIDYHRPDALRILDFPHAAERFTTIHTQCRDNGVTLEAEWPDQQRQRLKEEGGTAVLEPLRVLQQTYPQVGLDESISYLAKREQMLDYPHFRTAGWPIGSGVVESANKLVVEARLKGAGMHWRRDNVNPMLALRNVVCNKRWDECWPDIARGFRQKRTPIPFDDQEPPEPTVNRVQQYFQEMQRHHRAWEAIQSETEKAKAKKPWKPASSHPWRRPWPTHPRSAKK
jgi:hypothetical protein